MNRSKTIELVKKNHKSFIRQSIPMLFRPKNRSRFKEEITKLKNEALKTSRQGIIAALAGMRDRPNREILLTFAPYPIVLIASDYDPRIPIAESEKLAELSDDIQLIVLKGSGHISYIECLPQAVKAIKKALT